MDFSEAIVALKGGKKLAREGWNGKGMWIEIQMPTDTSKMTRPYVFMTIPIGASKQFGDIPDGVQTVPWLCSQTDLLAEDWIEVA